MTTTLVQVVAAVQGLALTVTGVRSAPDSLPATVQVFPAVITYPASGAVGANSAGFDTELHVIAVDLLVDSGEWERAYAQGTALLDLLLRKFIQNPTLNGMVQTFEDVSYSFAGQVELSGVSAIRWAILINGVKIQHTW